MFNEENKQQKDLKHPFYDGEIVFSRIKRYGRNDIKRFYELYNKTLPVDLWWQMLINYNQTDGEVLTKDSDDEFGYYTVNTKYLGKVKELTEKQLKDPNALFFEGQAVSVVWEARDPEKIMPGENYSMTNVTHTKNIISLSKMSIMTKEEIIKEVIESV